MGFSFSKPKPSPIAIDFGADSLKLLQVVPDARPQLVDAAAMPMPEHARFNAAARLDFAAEAVRSLLKQHRFKGRRVQMVIPAFQTLIQHLAVPRQDSEEVDELVDTELRQRLHVEPSRMVVRNVSVGQFVRNGQSLHEVICQAASREVVMGYIDVARRCRLDVVGMHSEPQCILRAFGHLYTRPEDAQRVTCFLDIGAAVTKVVIAHGSQMVFAKTIQAAGDHMTRQYAQRHKLSFSEARQARMAGAGPATPAEPATAAPEPAMTPALAAAPSRAQPVGATAGTGCGPQDADAVPGGTGIPSLDAQMGLTPPGRPLQRPDDEPDEPRPLQPPTSLQSPTRSADDDADGTDTIECLIEELQFCMRYYQRLFPDKQVEKLVFLGGESRDVPKCQQIARAVRVAAQLGDPFARLTRLTRRAKPGSVDLNQPQPGWAVPMGLCLSEANL